MLGDVEFHDRAAYLPDSDALVIADLHVGRGRASNVDFPIGEAADLVSRVGALLDRLRPETVVFAGDLLHAFDSVPRTVETTIDRLVTTVSGAGAELVVTPGNHDVQLETVYAGDSPDECRLGHVVVRHGHEEPQESDDAELYVIGHEHPAIRIEGRRYPCALYGRRVYRDRDVLVLPAFSRLASGTLVNGLRSRDVLSPFVRARGVGEFRPIVRDDEADETVTFPKLCEFESLL